MRQEHAKSAKPRAHTRSFTHEVGPVRTGKKLGPAISFRNFVQLPDAASESSVDPASDRVESHRIRTLRRPHSVRHVGPTSLETRFPNRREGTLAAKVVEILIEIPFDEELIEYVD